MNPDVSQTFNILRNLVPVKGKMVHSHNGYRMYDLENVRVSLDADEDHDTVTCWAISSCLDGPSAA